MKNRRVRREDLPPLPSLTTGMGVRDAISQIVDSIYLDSLDPKIGTALAPLLNLQLRAIEASDLEERFAKLEDEVF
jgi:hypothetical protein